MVTNANSESKRVLIFRADRCGGCRLCETVCSLAHTNAVLPSSARISIEKAEEIGLDLAIFCYQCKQRFCMAVCPVGAIKDNELGILVVDADMCIGCRKCEKACLYGGIKVTTSRKAIKCDLCNGEPMCATHCPTGALEYSVETETVAKVREEGMEELKKLHCEGKE